MWRILRRDPAALGGALLVHLLLLALLVVGLQHPPRMASTGTTGKPVIQAVAVDAKQVDREVQRLRRAREAKQARAAAERRKLAAERQALQRQRERQAREAEALKHRQAAEQRLAAQRKAAAARLAKARADAVAAQKKKAAEEARRKRLAQLAAKRKAEEARKRQQAAEQALRAQVAAEQRQVQAARAREMQAIAARYVRAIESRVEQNWLQPPGSAAGLSCTVEVQLIPGGAVTAVKIVKSSGDPVFDRSVETAVRKASPLPMPADPALFGQFRDLTFVFNPAQQGGGS